MRKRIISLLLTLVMLLSLASALGGTASAVSGEKEVNSYAELKAALEGNAYYIKLNRDSPRPYARRCHFHQLEGAHPGSER